MVWGRHPNTKRGRFFFGKIARPSLETLERIKKDRWLLTGRCRGLFGGKGGSWHCPGLPLTPFEEVFESPKSHLLTVGFLGVPFTPPNTRYDWRILDELSMTWHLQFCRSRTLGEGVLGFRNLAALKMIRSFFFLYVQNPFFNVMVNNDIIINAVVVKVLWLLQKKPRNTRWFRHVLPDSCIKTTKSYRNPKYTPVMNKSPLFASLR